MDAAVLGDLVARSRRSDAPALRAPGVPDEAYDYHRFCTTAWKTGNFLRHHGVRRGATVGVAAEPDTKAVLTLLGAALLGAVVRFDPPQDAAPKALVVPTDRLGEFEAVPGTRRIAYGERPEDPAVAHFERDVWSENPTEPPDRVEPDDPVLATAERSCAHRELLGAGRRIADEWDLARGESVAVRSPLTRPGTVAAGVVAPLLAGGTVLFPGEDETGDCAVADGDAPEERAVAPGEVLAE